MSNHTHGGFSWPIQHDTGILLWDPVTQTEFYRAGPVFWPSRPNLTLNTIPNMDTREIIHSIDEEPITVALTGTEWLNKLDLNLRETILKRIKTWAEGNGRNVDTILNYKYLEFVDFINNAFSWISTPEGHMFWSDLANSPKFE